MIQDGHKVIYITDLASTTITAMGQCLVFLSQTSLFRVFVDEERAKYKFGRDLMGLPFTHPAGNNQLKLEKISGMRLL